MKMKKLFLMVCTVFFSQNALCWGWIQEKTYEMNDGRTYTINYVGQKGPRASYVTIKDQEGNVTSSLKNDLDYIVVDDNQNVISSEFYHQSDITYIMNTKGEVIGKKSSWNGPVIETYKYSNTGKLLVYDSDGQFIGIYNDFMDRQANTTAGTSFWSPSYTGITQYVGSFNLMEGKEEFNEYNSDGKLIAKYSSDGTFKTYSYAPNGDYTIYDENGKSLGNFMENGEKRRIYHVDEAVAVVSKNGKNTFSIKYK